ncbi:MAG: hypothetical protein WD627_11590, partial [Actinomycetota bacterium]
MRRKSYIEQFKRLENRFGIQLRKFGRWKHFVESGQRRNLVAHCNSVVTEQYLSQCKAEGINIPDDVQVGDITKIGPAYLFAATFLVFEVGVKLAQTLWRKALPDELATADRHLNNTIFDLLWDEEWIAAERLGEYARQLPNMQRDADRRIAAINHAIALRQLNKNEDALSVLADFDWGETVSAEFRLAERILAEDYESAERLFRMVGGDGEFFDEHAYHSWPLFIDF